MDKKLWIFFFCSAWVITLETKKSQHFQNWAIHMEKNVAGQTPLQTRGRMCNFDFVLYVDAVG